MKKNNKGETLAGIVISIIIISIIFVSLGQILEYNTEIDNNFLKQNYIEILENNTNKTISKLDLNTTNIGDKIYISQNINNEIEFKNGVGFSDFGYINELGINIDKNSKGFVFFRECEVVLKNTFKQINCSIK